MFHIPSSRSSFFSILLKIDHDAVEALQARGCSYCGGCLDRADYPRKPRGLPADLDPLFSIRYSLCCRSDGCRRRVMPQSVRFFGRHVYLMFFILLTSSASTTLFSELSRAMGVSRQTLRRWQRFWLERFPQSPLWKRLQGRFSPPPAAASLPRELVKQAGCRPDDAGSMIPILNLLAFA